MAAARAKKKCPGCGAELEADAQFCPVDGTELVVVDPYIGVIVAGDIELTSVLGSGAMGSVYRGHQRSVGRDVAVKVLHRELSANTDLVTRFKREAKFASKLSHPHVVEVFLAGQLDDGALFIVMEYLDGESLADTLEREGALAVTRALGIALQICDAVGAGHASGIVHRDLKPENVMLVRRADTADWVKVLDFGIAKSMQGEQSVETAAGRIYGTARYISPEAAHGRGVTPASDVYSIAVMLFQMLAGTAPFDADNVFALIAKHVTEQPPQLRTVAPDVPEAIALVVMRNLDKDAANRAHDGHAFGSELMNAALASGIAVPNLGLAARLSRMPPTARAQQAPAVIGRGAAHVTTGLAETLNDAPAVPETALVAVQQSAPVVEMRSDDVSDTPRKPRRSAARVIMLVVLALLALAGAAALYMWRVAVRDHDDTVARAQQALADRHFVSPPGQNVNDIVRSGLAKWPGDSALGEVRGDAVRELATTSMAAHSAGDIEGADRAAKSALQMDPNDYAAKLLADEYDQELTTLKGPEAAPSSQPPCVLFTVPQLVKLGTSFDAVAHVYLRAAGPRGVIERAEVKQLTVRTDEGQKLPVVHAGTVFTAHITTRAVGRFYLKFEANVAGELMRAERAVDVTE